MMNPRRAWIRRGLMGVSLAAPLALATALEVTVQAADTLVTERESMAGMIDVAEVQSDASMVSGKLVNRTRDSLRNMKLVVTDDFQFSGKRQPGSENPSLVTEMQVVGPIPPGGSIPFNLDRPAPLPDRKDGTFNTSVSVVSFTRQPIPAAPPPPVPPKEY
jgi:hypothetical protein